MNDINPCVPCENLCFPCVKALYTYFLSTLLTVFPFESKISISIGIFPIACVEQERQGS